MLTWNLFHGRAKPAAGRPLLVEFCRALAGWAWDVALLQEVPPWWSSKLAVVTGADVRCALTSRNSWPSVRRAIGARNPDLITANGGGANAILVRGGHRIGAHRERELTRTPERRLAHGVALAGAGWIVNLHASTHPPQQRSADVLAAAATAREWAAGGALVLGGDLNWKQPAVPGLRHVAGHWVDHVFTEGRSARGAPEVLDAGPLSDHRPLRVEV